jgi:hypothetical protein
MQQIETALQLNGKKKEEEEKSDEKKATFDRSHMIGKS